MERIAVNPVTWSQEWGFDQGVVVAGATRTLHISGQTAMDEQGRPRHEGDLAGQLGLAVRNLEEVLSAAGMSLADLVRLDVATTSIEELMPHYGILAGRLAAAEVAPTTTMLEVRRLAAPGQMVELTGVAMG